MIRSVCAATRSCLHPRLARGASRCGHNDKVLICVCGWGQLSFRAACGLHSLLTVIPQVLVPGCLLPRPPRAALCYLWFVGPRI